MPRSCRVVGWCRGGPATVPRRTQGCVRVCIPYTTWTKSSASHCHCLSSTRCHEQPPLEILSSYLPPPALLGPCNTRRAKAHLCRASRDLLLDHMSVIVLSLVSVYRLAMTQPHTDSAGRLSCGPLASRPPADQIQRPGPSAPCPRTSTEGSLPATRRFRNMQGNLAILKYASRQGILSKKSQTESRGEAC